MSVPSCLRSEGYVAIGKPDPIVTLLDRVGKPDDARHAGGRAPPQRAAQSRSDLYRHVLTLCRVFFA